MDLIIVIAIIFAIVSSFVSNAKKAAEKSKRVFGQPPARPPQNIPEGESGNLFDEEFFGEGRPPVKPTESKPRPHTPKPHMTAAEPKHRTREAPKATVKSSLHAITATDADETEAASIEIAGSDMSFTGDNALRAVLYAEILAKPKALR